MEYAAIPASSPRPKARDDSISSTTRSCFFIGRMGAGTKAVGRIAVDRTSGRRIAKRLSRKRRRLPRIIRGNGEHYHTPDGSRCTPFKRKDADRKAARGGSGARGGPLSARQSELSKNIMPEWAILPHPLAQFPRPFCQRFGPAQNNEPRPIFSRQPHRHPVRGPDASTHDELTITLD